jgi:hypothetical protein
VHVVVAGAVYQRNLQHFQVLGELHGRILVVASGVFLGRFEWHSVGVHGIVVAPVCSQRPRRCPFERVGVFWSWPASSSAAAAPAPNADAGLIDVGQGVARCCFGFLVVDGFELGLWVLS